MDRSRLASPPASSGSFCTAMSRQQPATIASSSVAIMRPSTPLISPGQQTGRGRKAPHCSNKTPTHQAESSRPSNATLRQLSPRPISTSVPPPPKLPERLSRRLRSHPNAALAQESSFDTYIGSCVQCKSNASQHAAFSPCGHEFCSPCINSWLRQEALDYQLCPVCCTPAEYVWYDGGQTRGFRLEVKPEEHMSWLGIEDAREYALAETCAESPGKAHELEGGYQRLVQLSRHEGAGGAPGHDDCPATSRSMKARVKREALNYFVSGVIAAMAVLVTRHAFKRILTRRR